MITITIVASGTRGDVQPYIALGQGLQKAGYDVRLLASENFKSLATEAGLAFGSTGMSAEERIQSDEWRKTIEGGNFFAIMRRMQAEMKQAAAESARQTAPLLEGSHLIIAGIVGLTGVYTTAEKLNIPFMQAYLVPFTPTRAFSTPLVPKLPLGNALNRLSFHATRQIFWQSFKVSDTVTRQMLGLPKQSFWGPFRSLARQQTPILYGYSQHVLPRPLDWADHHHVTGYWFLDEPAGWNPPADLIAFLNAGDPPVYIGFGSMVSRNPQETGQIALEALERSGRRGILAAGWGGLQPKDLPDTIHLVSSLPHSWLFPRMAAVVHHGGAGTTAAGLRAGVPSIVVPFNVDQPFWGQRVAALGVGPQPIPRKKLTSERLANAMTEALANNVMRQRASDLGQKIRAEAGIGNAVAVIDRFTQQA
jgi:sterol 3beta-glucosyltransferase